MAVPCPSFSAALTEHISSNPATQNVISQKSLEYLFAYHPLFERSNAGFEWNLMKKNRPLKIMGGQRKTDRAASKSNLQVQRLHRNMRSTHRDLFADYHKGSNLSNDLIKKGLMIKYPNILAFTLAPVFGESIAFAI